MSFGGGGSADYRINYIISTRAEGQGAGPINQVSAATDKMTASNQKAVASASQLKTAHERVVQSGLGVSKAAKGMAFGMIGMTTAGAEMVGMLSMWQATQDGVKEAQAAVNKALEEGGKGSAEYTKATQDLAKANRWAQMTFRNLLLSIFDMIPFIVLTVNGILKLRTAMAAMREAKAMEAALTGVGAAASKMTKANTLLTASNLSHNGSLITTIPNLTKQRAGLDAVTKATNTQTVATSRLKTVLATVGKGFGAFAIILGAGAAAALAYKNNIGGFQVTFDKIGVSIGNAIPQLRGFLNMLKDLALAFPDLGKMWDIITGKKKEGFSAMAPTDEEIKQLEEAHEAIENFHDGAQDLFREIAMADKGDRKDFFKNLGITTGKTQFDDAKKGAREFFNALEKGLKQLDNVQMQFQAMEQFDIMKRFGLEVDDDTIKKIRFSMEDKLREVFKGGDDIFDKLADVVEQNAKKSQPEFNAAMAQFAADHPGFIDALEEMGYGDMAGYFDGLVTEAKAQMRKSLQSNLLTDESKEAQQWKDEWWDSMMGDDTVSEAEKAGTELVKGIITGFKNVDWSGIKTTLRMQIMDPLITSLETIGANVIPIVRTAITNNINKDITTEGAGGQVTGIDWNGLWNRILEVGSQAAEGDMGVGKAIWWTKNVEPRITAFWDQLTNIENWNRYAEEKKAAFLEIPKLAWAHVENAFATYILQPLQFVNTQAVKFVEQLTSVENWNKLFEDAKKAFAEIPKLLWAHIENAFATSTFGKGVNTVLDLAKKYLFNTAEGATPTVDVPININPVPQIAPTPKKSMIIGEGSRFGKSGTLFPSSLTEWAKKIQIPAISTDVPIDPKSYIINPPTTNTTPTIQGPTGFVPQVTVPTATLIPTSSTVSINTSKITPVFGNSQGPGDIPGQPPAAGGGSDPFNKRGLHQLRISIPGVDLVPQTATLFIDWNVITTSAKIAMLSIEKDWATVMTLISGLANTTVQAIAQVFGGMAINISEGMTGLANTWSAIANSFINNAESAADGITSAIESAMEDAESRMSDLASHWSKMCNSLINNAESAADGINDALDSIQDEEVKITYRAVGSPSNPVGKAHGTEGLWVHKPTLFMAGEQGSEFVSVTRNHSKPGMTTSEIGVHDEGGGTGTVIFNGAVNLRISGNEIINDTKLTKKIKMTVGENRDRFG